MLCLSVTLMARKFRIGQIRKYAKKKKRVYHHEDHLYCLTDITWISASKSTVPEKEHYFWPLPDFFFSSHDTEADNPAFTECGNPGVTESMDSDGCFADEHFVVLDKVYRYDPDNDLDSFVEAVSKQKYENLRVECRTIDAGSIGFVMTLCDRIQFVALYAVDNPGVKMSVTVSTTFQPIIMVHRKKLPKEHEVWNEIQRKTSTKVHVEELLNVLSSGKYFVCCGNPEEEFFEHLTINASNTAFVESDLGAWHVKTIRATDCHLLCEGLRCLSCRRYRGTLRKRRSMSSKNGVLDYIHSKKNHLKMTRSELITKINQTKDYYKKLEQDVGRLQRALNKTIVKGGDVNLVR